MMKELIEAATAECASPDGITIGLVDALITVARILHNRLQSEATKLKESDEEFAWFSPEVLEALADLRSNEAIRALMYPRDEVAMKLIHEAAELLAKRPGLVGGQAATALQMKRAERAEAERDEWKQNVVDSQRHADTCAYLRDHEANCTCGNRDRPRQINEEFVRALLRGTIAMGWSPVSKDKLDDCYQTSDSVGAALAKSTEQSS
jgi:hypothetical protein